MTAAENAAPRHVDLPPLPPVMAQHAPAGTGPDPQDAPPLRWAILGAGGIAHKFARDVARANSEVTAVGSETPGKAAAFAEEMGVGFAGDHADVLAQEDVDAIYVATTHDRHLQVAERAIAAGLPVLIEKPITRNVAELDQLRAAAEETGVLVMEAMWSRFLPTYRMIRELVRSGLLGEVRYVRAEHNQSLRGIDRLELPELAGGSALDLGVYSASFAHWVLGTPAEMHASGRRSERGVDLDAQAILRKGEATAVVTSSMTSVTPCEAVIGGDYGSIVLPRQFYRATEMQLHLTGGPLVEARGEEIHESWSMEALAAHGFEYEAAAFSRAYAEGLREVPGHGWNDAREVLAVLDAMRAAAGAVLPGE